MKTRIENSPSRLLVGLDDYQTDTFLMGQFPMNIFNNHFLEIHFTKATSLKGWFLQTFSWKVWQIILAGILGALL